MVTKLNKLLETENLTATKLAKILEIQPSGISHLLSGRNKPSYDFVVKLLQRFPRINPDWLLLDSDKMYRADNEGRQPAQATLPNVTAHTGSLFETQDINAAGSDSDGMIMSDRRMPDAEDGSAPNKHKRSIRIVYRIVCYTVIPPVFITNRLSLLQPSRLQNNDIGNKLLQPGR